MLWVMDSRGGSELILKEKKIIDKNFVWMSPEFPENEASDV